VIADLAAGMGTGQVGDDEQRVFERLEGFEDGSELEAGAGGGRSELRHDGAVGEISDAEAEARIGGSLCQRCECGDHGVEERQRERGAQAAQ
jgi:hypothetical protein